MTTALYRISSSEVLKISPLDQPFDDRDTVFFGVLVDPATPDGTDVRDMSGPVPGPLRVLGLAKHADVGANIARNSTQAEIDTYAPAELDDNNQQDADRAADYGDTHLQWRKLIKSILKGVVRENNIMATRYNELRAQVLAATSLADFQTRVQNNTSDAPTRTNQQAFDAIRNDVSKND